MYSAQILGIVHLSSQVLNPLVLVYSGSINIKSTPKNRLVLSNFLHLKYVRSFQIPQHLDTPDMVPFFTACFLNDFTSFFGVISENS